MCFLFHKWGKWNQYKVQVKEYFCWQEEENVGWSQQIRQKRTCTKCGKIQNKKVR